MKLSVLFLGAVFSLSAWAAKKPAYDFSSSEVYGSYEESSKDLAAVIKTVKGQPVIDLKEFGRGVIPLHEVSKGKLVFKWENPEHDDCDDPGCGNLLALSGVVYPKLKGGQYLPAVRVFARWEYPFPDEEDAPDGEVTKTHTYIKRK